MQQTELKNAYATRLNIFNELAEASLYNPAIFENHLVSHGEHTHDLRRMGLFLMAGLRHYGPDDVALMMRPNEANQSILDLLYRSLQDRRYRRLESW